MSRAMLEMRSNPVIIFLMRTDCPMTLDAAHVASFVR